MVYFSILFRYNTPAFQPRRLIVVTAAAGCKRLLGCRNCGVYDAEFLRPPFSMLHSDNTLVLVAPIHNRHAPVL